MGTRFSIRDSKPWKRTYFTIWCGQALSILSCQLVQFALIWRLTVQTGSASVLATASLAGLLPNVVLGPFVRTLVDRWDRRRPGRDPGWFLLGGSLCILMGVTRVFIPAVMNVVKQGPLLPGAAGTSAQQVI